MTALNYPHIIYPSALDERAKYEMSLKGWACVHVEAEQEKYYEVCFYHPVRLWQDFKEAIENGKPCFADYAAVVLIPEVTVEAIGEAVLFLWKGDYFKYWKPSDKIG